jgi:hypothetical protein
MEIATISHFPDEKRFVEGGHVRLFFAGKSQDPVVRRFKPPWAGGV